MTTSAVGDWLSLRLPEARLALFGLAIATLAFVGYETLTALPTVSLFARLGLPSPSIGLTRACWLLLHGHARAAIAMNPLVVPVVAVVAALAAVDAVRLARR